MFLKSMLPVLLLTAPIVAQMSGTYTVDPLGSGSRNYKDLQSAVYDAWKQGMSGPVVFEVVPGTYDTNEVSIVPINGMSATSRLTLKSKVRHKAILRGRLTLSLGSASKPVRGLLVEGFGMGHSGTAVYNSGAATDVEIKDCLFTAGARVYIAPGAAQWDVHHNLFDASKGGVTVQDAADVRIHHNVFRDMREDVIVVHSTPLVSGSKPVRIYNNSISGIQRSIILVNRAHGVEIVHNTVVSTSKSTYMTCIIIDGGSFTMENKLFGNVIVIQDAGTPLNTKTVDPKRFRADGNLYFHRKYGNIAVGNGNGYADVRAWQKTGFGTNSVQGDPQFVHSTSMPYDLHIHPTSPAVGRAVNTPSYVLDDLDGKPRRAKPDIGAYEAVIPFHVYGGGCAGTAAHIPRISHTGTPKIGSTDFTVTLGNALGGSTASVWFIVGLSNSTWGTIPLPLPLGGGCDLLVSADLLLTIPVSGLPGAGNGTAGVKIPIPNDPKFIGSKHHFQWGSIDAAAAGIGVAFSNAATLTL